MASKDSTQEKMERGWIHILVTFEIIGKPAKHVDETLQKFLGTIKEDPRVHWINEHVGKAKKTEGEYFGSYAEVEIPFEPKPDQLSMGGCGCVSRAEAAGV